MFSNTSTLANQKIYLESEKMTDELPIYHQVLYDQQAIQKCAQAFLNGEGSNPSGKYMFIKVTNSSSSASSDHCKAN